MKWNGYSENGQRTMKKLLSAKGFTYLLSILSLGLLLGASLKWHG